MDFFSQSKVSHLEEEEEKKTVPYHQYLKIPELKDTISNETDIRGKSSYYPNPALFRRLIEGTSFDHRTKKEAREDEGKERTESEGVPTASTQPYLYRKKASSRKMVQKKEEKTINTSSSSKKKQFIVKERKRLGNIVHEVLGYPQSQ